MDTLVISGGSKGIGLATARLFAAEGWKVVNVSRSPTPLAEARHFAIDMADPLWPQRHGAALSEAVAGSARVALVHCAAYLSSDAVTSLSTEEMLRALQVNVVAALQLNQLLLPGMGAGSSIIYIGSTLSEKAVPGSCAYVVSKHAQLGLMRATCQDLAGRGIHTACVCPGFTDTEMLRAHLGGSPTLLHALEEHVTFGRLIETGEIARSIQFCALNPVINGAVIHANLGQVER